MSKLAGTKRLVRLYLRLDRVTVPATLLLAIGMVAGSAPALVTAYPDYATRLAYVTSSVTSVVGRLFQGTIQGVSLGSVLMAETFMTTAVIMAIMSIFIVSRHTRYDEETGASELIGSMRVGRNSPLTGALFVAVLANLIAGLIIFLALATVPELDKTGSAFFSMSLAMTGIFFAGVAAITVQLSDYRRGANMMALSVLGLAFIVRAVGDAFGDITPDGLGVTASWLSWLSPLGWANQVLPYYDNNPLPLLLLVVGSVAAAGVGYYILGRRDLGSSVIPSKPGKPRASKSLLSTAGLTKKLQKPGLIAWTVGAVMFGVMMGAVVNDFKSTFEENETFQEFLATTGMTDNFAELMISSMFPLIGAMLAGYVVSALGKMQDEEGNGRLEFLFSTKQSRGNWMGGYIASTTIGSIIVLGSLGLAGAIGYSVATDVQEVSFGAIVSAGLASVPAMLLFASVILLVFASFGRFVKSFAWGFFAYCVLIATFAGIFKWPEWTLNLSPFSHTPAIPSSDVDFMPLIVMGAMAVAISAVSIMMFNRRDVNLK